MKPYHAFAGALVVAMLFAGCKPQPSTREAETVVLVPAAERSSHFAAVSSQLELGGTLYGYVDVEGDVLKVVPFLRTLAENVTREQPMAAPFLQQDFAQILVDLGFNDVKAIGLSSVPSKDGGFRNRVYLHTPDGRRGLFAGVMGGAPAAFSSARLAPADADLYAETDVNAPALYAAVRALVAKVAGEPMAGVMDIQLQADSGLGVTAEGVIQSLKGRVALIVRTDPEKTITLPGETPFVMPAARFLVRVDGLGASLAPALDQVPLFAVSQEGAVKVYAYNQPLPVEGVQPVLAVEGSALYLASDADFLRESLARTDGLDQLADYRAALAEVGETGNGVLYVNPRLFDQLRRLDDLNPELAAESTQALGLVLGNLPTPTRPLISVHENKPEGVLYQSRWHRSLKQDVAMIGVYNPVTIGVMAAMAIPAFQKVQSTSQEKAVINNLRQLSAAADQHMLENGVKEARYHQLVGSEPDKYIRSLQPVAGEDYTTLVIREGDETISVTLGSGKTVSLPR